MAQELKESLRLAAQSLAAAKGYSVSLLKAQ